MENEKPLTFEQQMQSLIEATETLTQEQVNACAWVMGGSGVGWTPDLVRAELNATLNLHLATH
jgi:hypothetical protein